MPEEHISDTDEIEEEEEIVTSRKPKSKLFGLLAVIFAAVVLLLIGGLASYYYYNFQSGNSGEQKSVKENWNIVVSSTEDLITASEKLTDSVSFIATGSGSFQAQVGTTNRALRDIMYDIEGNASYITALNPFNNQLKKFLDDYVAYLRELQRLIDVTTSATITSEDDLKQLATLNSDMENSYDSLISADKTRIMSKTLSRDLFKVDDKISEIIKQYLKDKGDADKLQDAANAAAGSTVTKFMQGYMNKEVDTMKLYLTAQAQKEFNPVAVTEDSSDISSFKIVTTTKVSDTKITISAQLIKNTPDGKQVTENRLFALLKQSDEKWLIDSWKTS